jgi:hypothetical protein
MMKWLQRRRRQTEVSVSARSGASPHEVFRLLKDGSSWPRWSMFDRFHLERKGRSEPLGVGAIRVSETRISKVREEVTGMIEDQIFEYRLLSGLPLRDYQACVSLRDAKGGGTAICWTALFGPQPLGRGMFWRVLMRRVLRRTARDLAREADRRHSASVADRTLNGKGRNG